MIFSHRTILQLALESRSHSSMCRARRDRAVRRLIGVVIHALSRRQYLTTKSLAQRQYILTPLAADDETTPTPRETRWPSEKKYPIGSGISFRESYMNRGFVVLLYCNIRLFSNLGFCMGGRCRHSTTSSTKGVRGTTNRWDVF